MEGGTIPRRIVVVGVTGSGKTTLARTLAYRLGCRWTELDALHWLPDWKECPTEDFRVLISEALAAESWVVDGNYSKARNLIWTRAEMLVWLDYPLPLILWRLARRTWCRIRRHEILWNGNREQWRNFLGKDSLFLWAIQSHRRHRQSYPALFEQPEYAHLCVARLRSPQETEDWLMNLGIEPSHQTEKAPNR